jgi:hypothetical protein
LPLEFFEARNAVRTAQSAGADKYAETSYENAVRQMDEADAIATGKHKNKKSLIALSREVVQTAEDAREIAVKNMDEEEAETDRRDELDREASSKDRADEESRRRLHAEAATAYAVRPRNRLYAILRTSWNSVEAEVVVGTDPADCPILNRQ